MPHSLASSLRTASPRYAPPPTPLRSVLIHGAVLVLWALLFAMAFRYTGVLAWSTGVAYVTYDTLLLGFVFWKTMDLAKTQAAPQR